MDLQAKFVLYLRHTRLPAVTFFDTQSLVEGYSEGGDEDGGRQADVITLGVMQ
ncbi:hypothetical protein [Fulvivirga sedimenti]|uniref:Uncharacterized protein n=1 Tax=Fulvivirga sedimenti TaxID=2879465 RepID=A0A9X1L334_9BACT|nr:hypothetical protein [Fulvivirga sedimenti]MCA6078826.1 hypothetical protein [Fulvivirga sedimenti]